MIKTEEIRMLLHAGKIEEADTSNLFKDENSYPQICSRCVFGMRCVANKKLPCMAHNREDRRSIYYKANNV